MLDKNPLDTKRNFSDKGWVLGDIGRSVWGARWGWKTTGVKCKIFKALND
jgi:hypothetical protein